MVEQYSKANLPIPEKFVQPELPTGLFYYYEVFIELHSDRQVGFGNGAIPTTAILAYAKHYELSDDEESDLIYFIRALDAAYLNYCNTKTSAK